MFKNWFTLTVMMLAVFSLAACKPAAPQAASEKPKEEAPTKPAQPTQAAQDTATAIKEEKNPMIITDDDNGKTISLSMGDTLAVALKGNPTTGYIWEVGQMDDAALKALGEEEFKADSPELVGSGGTQTLAFNAVKAGETKLVLIYHRPWEKDVPAEKTFEITVQIK